MSTTIRIAALAALALALAPAGGPRRRRQVRLRRPAARPGGDRRGQGRQGPAQEGLRREAEAARPAHRRGEEAGRRLPEAVPGHGARTPRRPRRPRSSARRSRSSSSSSASQPRAGRPASARCTRGIFDKMVGMVRELAEADEELLDLDLLALDLGRLGRLGVRRHDQGLLLEVGVQLLHLVGALVELLLLLVELLLEHVPGRPCPPRPRSTALLEVDVADLERRRRGRRGRAASARRRGRRVRMVMAHVSPLDSEARSNCRFLVNWKRGARSMYLACPTFLRRSRGMPSTRSGAAPPGCLSGCRSPTER